MHVKHITCNEGLRVLALHSSQTPHGARMWEEDILGDLAFGTLSRHVLPWLPWLNTRNRAISIRKAE